ncbi:class I SAM-dependent methyltransferase [Streptomyces sp. GC420]|uniref:class I SAM-dependent methyltransferase n=1 Tax=Streptomyces sp. GC420 TaxID=2697568 RepID=UPI001414CC27|nr:class I SAM-dependent methyltransferase [Streptomyces sp. GC420]NBM15172.1 methyltransferase domain-containing protein [Streptomyces sp. GC420]
MREPSYLGAVRDSYDAVAADYVEIVKTPDQLDPVSRAMLAAFAELVRTAGLGPVADLGCGPGRVTAHLAGLGLTAFGVDVSPRMIELARHAFPGLRFEVGSMTALEIGDEELGGVLAYFSIHHTPPEVLPAVFSEFHRTLAPGGCLMLGTHAGDGERWRPARAYGGHEVSYVWYLLPPDRIAQLLRDAGFVITARLALEPVGGGKRPSVALLAHKPATGGPSSSP